MLRGRAAAPALRAVSGEQYVSVSCILPPGSRALYGGGHGGQKDADFVPLGPERNRGRRPPLLHVTTDTAHCCRKCKRHMALWGRVCPPAYDARREAGGGQRGSAGVRDGERETRY